MDYVSQTAVIGVDGGGTRCRLAYDDGTRVTAVEVGSANVSTDFDGTVAQLEAGLRLVAGRAGIGAATLAAVPAFLGVAGVTGPAMSSRLGASLSLARARIADDRPAALRGALGARDGVLAHCGTGSFFAAQIGGRTRFVGAWGAWLGDEASAQWVAKLALRLALDTVDGLTPPSPMTDRLLSDLDGAPGIVSFARKASPSEFGALAPVVTQQAACGDPLAETVLSTGAGEIVRTLRRIGWVAGLPICLTGGIGPHYAAYLPSDMQAAIAPPEAEPLAGALSLAWDFAREIAHERS